MKLTDLIYKPVDKMKPLFEKGGLFAPFYPLYEAGDTFLRTPADVTRRAPHARDSIDMKRVMVYVIYALMPCFLFGIFNAGYQFNTANQIESAGWVQHLLQGLRLVLPIVLTSYLVGGLWEVLFACVRKHEINEGFLVTGMLFPLTLPPTIPLWQVAVGISFGVVIGKEIFGGVGYNILNPALTARAFLFFAYPAQITGDTVWVATAAGATDAVTGATPLGVAAAAQTGSITEILQSAGYSLQDLFIGLIPASIGASSTLAVLLGLAFLLITGVASWQIMLSGVLGLTVTALLFNLIPAGEAKPITQLPPLWHMVSGGFAFGLVFMATDPVSAAKTRAGKWIYGFMIGVLNVIIRVANPAFPEGTMLAILFMNVMRPLIDHGVVQAHIRSRTRYARRLNHA
jgi:Na+-transporting NADH:ubiquinone oxidoreductase subunit B